MAACGPSNALVATAPSVQITWGLMSASWLSMLHLAAADAGIAARVRKLLRRPREELYDLERDPAELHNLVEEEGHEARRSELAHQLRCWMEEVGDSLTLPKEIAGEEPCHGATRGGLGMR